MANSAHNYAKEIEFDSIPKERFDILLDQVKIINNNEYNEEALDGFKGLVEYWNESGASRLANKILSNMSKI